MVKINDIELVDMETFKKFEKEIKAEIEQLKLLLNPKRRKAFEKLGKENVKISELKGEDEKSDDDILDLFEEDEES
jgi:hypothetical protein